MERLSGLDATFVYAETTTTPFEIASCVVADPTRAAEPYSFDRVRETMLERLPLVPRFRQRLVRVPLELDVPAWVDDPDFDLDRHVQRSALPSPGGREELEAHIAEILSHPLDHGRPLWELHVVEGLEGGRLAGVVKTHHAAMDGVAGFQLLTALLDTTPDAGPPEVPDSPRAAGPLPSAAAMVASAVPTLARQPLRTGRSALQLARGALRQVTRGAGKRRSGPRPDTSAKVGRADVPPTRFNARVTARRRVALVDLPFDDVRAVSQARDCTVNDVILSVAGGALRRYLTRHDELPEPPLVAFVPVSTRSDGEGGTGNSVSLVYASLGTHLDDPLERLEAVAASTRRAKSDHRESGAPLPTDLTDVTGSVGAALTGRVLAEGHLNQLLRFGGNVVVSNIPGPEEQLYLAGTPIERIYPLGPVVDGNALNITLLSYGRQTMSLGLVADHDVVPDLADLAGDLRAAFEELRAAPGGHRQQAG